MTELKGYFAALPTPFSPDGERIEEEPLGALVARNLEVGLTGLYVGGSTGEPFLLSIGERETILRVAIEASEGHGTMIAHVGDPNPKVSARLARVAADLGYHAISAVPPFYYHYGIEEIVAHYAWLSRQTDLPFLIYNFPDLSGVRWSVNDMARLLDLPGIVGVKNTCGDLSAFETLRRRVPEKVLLHGFDETLLAGLSLGADGGIGSTYNVQPDRIMGLAAAHCEGRAEEARALQAKANELIDAMISAGVLPALKYLLSRQGIPMGHCRRPFAPLSEPDRRKLDVAAEKHLSGGRIANRQVARG